MSICLLSGHESSAKQNCHPSFFGEFSYNVTYVDASVSNCTGNDHWDVCTDYQTMSFNTTRCNQTVAYAGQLFKRYLTVIELNIYIQVILSITFSKAKLKCVYI